MQIIPTLLTNNIQEFTSQFENLKKYYSRFQIDIADNIFVPNRTLQIEDISELLHPRGVHSATSGVLLDFHLMVKDYEADIEKLEALSPSVNIKTVFVHAELNPNYQSLVKNHPRFSFGLVLNPEDTIETIKTKYDLNEIKNIQIMTITPGFQGNSFKPEMLNKIEQLRVANYKSNIFIDGSANDKTIPLMLRLKYPPDFVGVGSYFTRADNLENRVKILESIIRHVPQAC